MTHKERTRSIGAVCAEPGLVTRLGVFGALVIIWWLYSTITEAPVAIKHDMAEAYAWGQEFQLGYNQHPPFWAWICGLWFNVLPRSGWAFALLSSVNAAIGLWGAWMLIGNFAAGRKRMAAWLMLLLTPLYTFYAYKYDANIIFLSIWPWTMHYFMKSVRTSATGDAIALGLLAGLALMSKYYALILLATCFLAALLHPARWKYFRSPAPYISSAIAAAVCVPHVAWLLNHQAPPLRYLAKVSGQGWHDVLVKAAKTLVSGVGMNLGPVFAVALVVWLTQRYAAAPPERFSRDPLLRVIAMLALAPLVLTITSALLLRTAITPEMTIGTFALLPLLIIEVAGVRDIDRLYRTGLRLAGLVTFGALALAPAIALVRTHLSPNAMNIKPFQEVAAEATRLWRERTSLPLVYVAGTRDYENATAFYSPERPHVFAYFLHYLNLWVTPDDLVKQGLLSVCVREDTACLTATAALATPQTTRAEVTLAHEFWGHVASPVDFVITIIPPRM